MQLVLKAEDAHTAGIGAVILLKLCRGALYIMFVNAEDQRQPRYRDAVARGEKNGLNSRSKINHTLLNDLVNYTVHIAADKFKTIVIFAAGDMDAAHAAKLQYGHERSHHLRTGAAVAVNFI